MEDEHFNAYDGQERSSRTRHSPQFERVGGNYVGSRHVGQHLFRSRDPDALPKIMSEVRRLYKTVTFFYEGSGTTGADKRKNAQYAELLFTLSARIYRLVPPGLRPLSLGTMASLEIALKLKKWIEMGAFDLKDEYGFLFAYSMFLLSVAEEVKRREDAATMAEKHNSAVKALELTTRLRNILEYGSDSLVKPKWDDELHTYLNLPPSQRGVYQAFEEWFERGGREYDQSENGKFEIEIGVRRYPNGPFGRHEDAVSHLREIEWTLELMAEGTRPKRGRPPNWPKVEAVAALAWCWASISGKWPTAWQDEGNGKIGGEFARILLLSDPTSSSDDSGFVKSELSFRVIKAGINQARQYVKAMKNQNFEPK